MERARTSTSARTTTATRRGRGRNANDYVRTIDFAQPASRATWVTYAAPVTGGPAVQGNGQQNITPANTAWAQQLEIWITPWGFLKGAAANNATVRAQTIANRRFNIVTFNAPAKSPGRPAVSGRRLHRSAGAGRARPDVGGESGLRRHARRGRIHELSRRQRPDVPGRMGAEARRPSVLRAADSRRERQSREHPRS